MKAKYRVKQVGTLYYSQKKTIFGWKEMILSAFRNIDEAYEYIDNNVKEKEIILHPYYDKQTRERLKNSP